MNIDIEEQEYDYSPVHTKREKYHMKHMKKWRQWMKMKRNKDVRPGKTER